MYDYYFRQDVEGKDIKKFRFTLEDYRTMGLLAGLLSPFPIIEAHQLVNRWNKQQSTPRFIYYL